MSVALALGASLAYGLSNWLGPRLARNAPLMLLLIVGQGCSFVLACVFVAARGEPAPESADLGWALLAGLGNAGGLVLFYRAAQIGPLSIITPIGAMGAALPVAVGVAGGEALTMMKTAGVVLALGGLVLVSRRPDRAAPKDADRTRVVVLSVISAVFFGVFLAAMGPAAEDQPAWAVAVSRASLLVILAMVIVRERAYEGVAPRRLPLLAVPGLLLFLGTIAYATATKEGDLSVVSVLGTLFPIVTVSLALGFDGERLTRQQGAGVATAIAGAVLLSAR